MSLHITTVHDAVADAVVVRIAGAGERRLLLSLSDDIAALVGHEQRVVIDMENLVLTSAGALRAFISVLFDQLGTDRVVFSCARRTTREVLRRWGGDDITVVSSTSEAVSLPPVAVAS